MPQTLRSVGVFLGAVALLFGSGGCDAAQPLWVENLTTDSFGPNSGAAHVVVFEDGTRIRWYEGFYKYEPKDAGLIVPLVNCATRDTVVTTLHFEYTTDFTMTIDPQFAGLTTKIRELVRSTVEFDSVPVPISISAPQGEGLSVSIKGVFDHYEVPITAYLDRYENGNWIKVSHATSTFRYRYFHWLFNYKKCHDQGGGGPG